MHGVMRLARLRTKSRCSAFRSIALALLVLACDAGSPARDAEPSNVPPSVLPNVLPNVPPNIVLVIADDQGWRDYGFMGSRIARTPNLDALAASGTVFTHGFTTASACRPSLKSLLSGLEPQRIRALEQGLGERNVPFPEIAAMIELDTLPRQLRRAGYVSFQGGKHWEGHFEQTGFDAGTAVGFDAERAKRHGAMHELSGGAGLELGRSTLSPLLDFVRAHRDQPFFVWFAPMLPHVPHDPPPEFRDPYAQAGLGAAAQAYFGNVSRLDARVGELLGELDALGLRERTLFVFVADNGWQQDPTLDSDPGQLGGAQGKFSIGELGFRTPMIFSWPGSLPAGRRDDSLVSTLDLFPTLLDFAGVRAGGALEPPSGRTGVDLRGLLEGRPAAVREHLIAGTRRLRADYGRGSSAQKQSDAGFAAVNDEEAFFLRARDWRYVWLPGLGLEQLFAIDDDPEERHDVAARHPDLVARYRAAVDAWRREMSVPAPVRAEGSNEPARNHRAP